MKAAEITDATIAAIARPKPPRFLRLNYANGDMVGHTGDLGATIVAVETMDLALGRLLGAVEKSGGVALVTADHGNADQMYRVDPKTGEYLDSPLTSHTLNAVPLYLFDPSGARSVAQSGGLANVAATGFNLLGFEAPEGYASSLLR
jgi:2,3-bisphosphoglycerate-independent phosphoglycerate mutase